MSRLDEMDKLDRHDNDEDVCCCCGKPCERWNHDEECSHEACEADREGARVDAAYERQRDLIDMVSYNKGHIDGYNEGYAEGLAKGAFEAAKLAYQGSRHAQADE